MEILDKSYSIFEEKMKNNRSTRKNDANDNINQLKTPKFNEINEYRNSECKNDQKKINFDIETVKKIIQPTQEEIEWEETTILLTQAIGKVLRSFLSKNLNIEKDFNFYTENGINSIISKYSKYMKLSTPKLASTLLNSLQEIYNSNSELFLNQFENIWKIYEEMGKFITSDFYLNNLCTMATSSKMVSNVLEILKEIFLKERNLKLKPDLLKGKNLENLLSFANNLIKSSRNSEGLQTITNPQRLLFDEKIIFEFIEKVSKLLDYPESWKIFSDFLCSFIYFDINDPHSEAYCRKSLDIFESFFTQTMGLLVGTEETNLSINNYFLDKNKIFIITDFIFENISKLLIRVKELCSMRNKNEYVSILIKNNKTQIQLWHFSSSQLIKILSLILCQNPKKKEEENIKNKNISFNNSIQQNTFYYFTSKLNEKENLYLEDKINEIWDLSTKCFESIFEQSEIGYKNISKNLLEDLLKSCQEIEIQIINFIVNALLPNSTKIPKEIQIKLLNLIDIGSNFDYNITTNILSPSINNSKISRVCIENLFELCKYRTEESLKKGK